MSRQMIIDTLAEYGATLTDANRIIRGSTPSTVTVTVKGEKLYFEISPNRGQTYDICPQSVRDFVESFWFWRKITAPWRDSNGNTLSPGDTIRHPDGTTGVIIYLPNENNDHNRWRVRYGVDDIARLGLQIGPRGLAVKI